MAYCLAADVIAVLPGLPQTTTASGWTQNLAIVNAHIPRADAMINANLARRYTTPFAETATSTPPIIRQMSEDITSYLACRSLFTRDNVNRSEYLDDLYARAKENLDLLREGKIDIVGSTGSLVGERNSGNNVYSTTEGHTPMFGMDDELNSKIDVDLAKVWLDRR